MNETEEEIKEETEVIPGPATSVSEMENAIFNYIMTLTKYYMDAEGLPKALAASATADLLERYVNALRSTQ